MLAFVRASAPALRALATAFTLAIQVPACADAQRIFGTVFRADGMTAAPGTVVTVTDAAGKVLGRDVTTARGDYVIPLAAGGPMTITALRVGSEPEVLRGVDVVTGRDLRRPITLVRDARRPTQVTVRGREVCDLAGDTTGVASLWAQFQIALASNEAAELAGGFVGSWSQADFSLGASLRDTLTRELSSHRLGLDQPVLPQLRADSSARLGFVLETDQGVFYHAPGLATLRAPTFLTRRCFSIEPAPPGQPSWIGLHFRATGDRIGTVEIDGTVWFDAATLEPHALTFFYTGLPPAFGPAEAGGAIRFNKAVTGHWIADEWMLRIPSARYRRMFAYDTRGIPSGYGNLSLDGVRVTVARLMELTVNGNTIYRRAQ